MTWSGFFKSLSIFLIAVGLVTIGSFFAFQYLMAQFTALPPKPTFPNDKTAPATKAIAAPSPTASTSPIAVSPSPSPVAASPSPSPSPGAAYQARVKLDNGLNVRESPNADAPRVGGVDLDQVVTVLEESQDKEWQRIRVETTGVEGWIKSGYIDRVNN
jgi:cytoskeletal protein RodZ